MGGFAGAAAPNVVCYSGVMPHPRLNLAIGFALFVASATLLKIEVQAQSPSRCERSAIKPCTSRHGRFSTQNGVAQVIWLIGTTRKVRVNNDAADFFPADVLKYTDMASPDHSYIFGNFTICPTEPDTLGHIGAVCVSEAKNLVGAACRQIAATVPYPVHLVQSDTLAPVYDARH